ncbi:MAG: hypothetical protein ACFNME_06330 [Actinomyces dentalis]
MTMKRGVSLYSYQQSQYLGELDLEAQIREVGTNLGGATGIEVVDEMSFRYPDPGPDFERAWFGWMDKYGTAPAVQDVSMDVLQFRDHVMTHEECAERLRHDLRLAKRLGFERVRVLSVVPIEVLKLALPLAEELDLPMGKEVHQPMKLDGRQVTEIIDCIEKTGTEHLGIVPDFGIFQFAPSPVQLGQHQRRGAKPEAARAVTDLSLALRAGTAPFTVPQMVSATAGNLRVDFQRFLLTGEATDEERDAFEGIRAYTDEHVPSPTDRDYILVAESIMFSNTDPDLLRQLVPHVTSVHAKFNYMSEIEGRPGHYEEATIDYDAAIGALKAGGYEGWIDTEYEGQRYLQDLPRDQLMDEVDQVRRHQEMLKRLVGA